MRRFDGNDVTLAKNLVAKNHAVEVIRSHRNLAALARHLKKTNAKRSKSLRSFKTATDIQASHGRGVKSSECSVLALRAAGHLAMRDGYIDSIFSAAAQ
ncbi:MAG TPA: hypothetical protein VH107_21525 [Lacipirellulaceae bacterium]|nr:hypothetical protein [Lacipirellulaceae bacterium]